MSVPETVQIAQNGTFVFDANRWCFEFLRGVGAFPMSARRFPLVATLAVQGQEQHYEPGYHEQWFPVLTLVDATGNDMPGYCGPLLAWRRSPSR
jgi:hypothetical protein